MDRHDSLNKRWYEGLIKALDRGESPEEYFKHMDGFGVRDTSEAAAAKFLQDQYGVKDVNDIKKHFEKPELLDNISITENPKITSANNASGLYLPKEKKIALASGEDLATGLHELSHPYDEMAHGYHNLTDALTSKKVKGMDLGAKGLEAAEELNKGHFFEDSIKGLEQLKRLIKGDKLRSMATALAPALKYAGPAAAAYGMSQGDAFAADPTGLLQSDELGKGSDQVQQQEQFDFSPYKAENQKNFSELRKKLLPSS